MKLTPKQKRFVEAYTGNATEAALKAGYSQKTAAFIGAENLKKHQIIQAIFHREKKAIRPLIATREERQKFWTSAMQDTKQDMRDRLRASELLGKSEGDFLERVEMGGKNGGPIQIADLASMSNEQLDAIIGDDRDDVE